MDVEKLYEAPKIQDLLVLTSLRWLVRVGDFQWWPIPFAGVPLAAFFGFPLWFAPGWANGWPFGLSIYVVWSAGMTAVLSVMFMSLTIGLGAAVCRLVVNRVGIRLTWTGLGFWLAIVVGMTAVLSVWAYRESYASTLEMWPNGYGP